jgi:hypothetical protein
MPWNVLVAFNCMGISGTGVQRAYDCALKILAFQMLPAGEHPISSGSLLDQLVEGA